MAPESENPLTIIIRNCPCLTRCTFKVSAYDSIHITDCQKLDMLELSGRWCDSEKIVLECPAVRRLGIEDAGLSEVPELVYRFAALQALSLHQNSLAILPDSLAVLVNLQYIGLSGNRFESVPLVLAKFPNLKKIKMGWQTADTAGNNSLREGFEIFSMIAGLEEVELFLPDEQLRKMAWHLRKPKARFIPCGLKWKFEK